MCTASTENSKEQPAIYYVVKGRLFFSEKENAIIPFEEIFIHESPIIAREQAFDFYKNYATILEAHQELSYKPLNVEPLLSNTDFGGVVLEKYSVVYVSYSNPKLFDKGIAVYMVVQNPATIKKKTDQKDDRFLIHGIWNFDVSDIKEFTTGLTREFDYYINYKYDTANYEVKKDFTILEYFKFDWQKPTLRSILSTPFHWDCNYYLLENSSVAKTKQRQRVDKDYLTIESIKFKRNDSIEERILQGDLIDNAFVSELNISLIAKTIASLLNENGGFLFIGVDKNRKSINVFDQVPYNDFTLETFRLIKIYYAQLAGKITASFHKVDEVNIVLFTVLPSPNKAIFITENGQNVFYRRNNFGFYPVNDCYELLNYWSERRNNFIGIEDFLKQL